MRSRLVLVLVVLVLVAGGLDVWLALRNDPGGSQRQFHPAGGLVLPQVGADGRYRVGTLPPEQQAALQAAVADLPLALSYDYRSLDQGLAKATAQMTPSFADGFSRTFIATTRTLAVQKKAITSALVRAAGVIGPAGGDLNCLVYLDQVLVSSATKKPGDPLKVSQNRVHVLMRRSGGAWKIDGIEPF